MNESLVRLETWDDHFQRGAELAQGSDELTEIRMHFDDADMKEVRSFYESGGLDQVKKLRADEASRRIDFDVDAKGRYVIKVDGKAVDLARTDVEAEAMIDKLIKEGEKSGKKLDKIKLRNIWKFAGPLVEIIGWAETVRIFWRISEAKSKEEMQQVIAEESSNIFSFLLGSKLTFEVFVKLIKPTTPQRAIGLAVLSLMGGVATAMGINEPLEGMIKHFLDKFPNGYELTKEAGALLESASLMSSATMSRGLIATVGKKALESKASKEALEFLGKKLTALAEKEFVNKLAKSCGMDTLKMLLKKAGWKGAVAGGAVLVDGPAPIGDALAAIFLALTAKDVYDLSNLVWEGYLLNDELNRRLPLPIAKFVISEPPSLIERYGVIDEGGVRQDGKVGQ